MLPTLELDIFRCGGMIGYHRDLETSINSFFSNPPAQKQKARGSRKLVEHEPENLLKKPNLALCLFATSMTRISQSQKYPQHFLSTTTKSSREPNQTTHPIIARQAKLSQQTKMQSSKGYSSDNEASYQTTLMLHWQAYLSLFTMFCNVVANPPTTPFQAFHGLDIADETNAAPSIVMNKNVPLVDRLFPGAAHDSIFNNDTDVMSEDSIESPLLSRLLSQTPNEEKKRHAAAKAAFSTSPISNVGWVPGGHLHGNDGINGVHSSNSDSLNCRESREPNEDAASFDAFWSSAREDPVFQP